MRARTPPYPPRACARATPLGSVVRALERALKRRATNGSYLKRKWKKGGGNSAQYRLTFLKLSGFPGGLTMRTGAFGATKSGKVVGGYHPVESLAQR